MKSAQQQGAKFAARYWRRIIGLLALGLSHIALIFQGGILVMYAILGSLLFLFRKSTVKTLKGWAIAVYSLQFIIVSLAALAMTMGEKFAPEEMAKEMEKMEASIVESRAVFEEGNFAESVALRFAEWSEVITFGMIVQGFGAFAFFLFGLAAIRADIISNPSAPI